MKQGSVIIIFCTILVAVSAAVVPQPRDLILDGIIRKLLEQLRDNVKDLQIPDQSVNFGLQGFNITLDINKTSIQHLDKFVIRALHTQLIPLRVNNLTITLDNAFIAGNYSFSSSGTLLDVEPFSTKGSFRIEFKGLFFTIGAQFELKNFKVQIVENGLYGFGAILSSSDIRIENLLGGGDKEEVANRYLSELVPDLVRDYAPVLFKSNKKQIIHAINKALTGSKIASFGESSFGAQEDRKSVSGASSNENSILEKQAGYIEQRKAP